MKLRLHNELINNGDGTHGGGALLTPPQIMETKIKK